MALRSTCICDGKLIGIESIFSVVDGMQINIPEKVEALRRKSKKNKLYCPCGCGANLVLVAGDCNLREQHFRLKEGQSDTECNFISEGPVSIHSKIVLKCWLQDQYPDAEIQSRVPICEVDDTNRRYEMTFLAESKKIAISYCHERLNFSDEKLGILDRNTVGIHLHYICDIENAGMFAQYPEMMIKVQKRQKYCLFLELCFDDRNMVSYAKSKLKAVFYYYNDSGWWEELEIVSDFISFFSFDHQGGLLYSGKPVLALKDQCVQQYTAERKQQRQKDIAYLERLQALTEEVDRKEKQQLALERKAQKVFEKVMLKCTIESIDAIIDADQEHPFYDSAGNRWVRCEYCGRIFTDVNFVIYGGINHVNLGTCKKCSKKTVISVLPKYAVK